MYLHLYYNIHAKFSSYLKSSKYITKISVRSQKCVQHSKCLRVLAKICVTGIANLAERAIDFNFIMTSC